MYFTRVWEESNVSSMLRRLIRNKSLVLGSLLLGLMICQAITAPWITSCDPRTIDAWHRLEGISRAHPLGTDELGRDIYSRVVYGARVSLTISFVGVGVALVAGVTLGCLAGYGGRRADNVIMRVMDVIFAFPAILLALVVMVAVGPGPLGVVIAISIVFTAPFARVVRGATLSIKKEQYVEAARSVGVPNHRIVLRHILPNLMASILVLYTLRLSEAVLIEASLSFLGLGVQPPTPAWGYMLSTGKSFMEQSPWAVIGPGLAMVLTITGFSLFGDGVRDVLDPTMRV